MVQMYVAVSKVMTIFIAIELTQSLCLLGQIGLILSSKWLLVATSHAVMRIRLTEVIGKIVMTN